MGRAVYLDERLAREAQREELIPILDRDALLCNTDGYTDSCDQRVCEDTEMAVDDKDAPTELQAHFTLTSTVLFAVGQTIGSGIFVSPNEVVKQVQSPGMALLIWVLSGFISLCGALSFSELGTLIKRSGGELQYIKAAYGDLPAFLYFWVCGVIRNSMGCAVIGLTFSSYLVNLAIPHTHPNFVVVKKCTAALAIVVIIAVMTWSTKWGVRMANLFCILKLLALTFLMVLGVWQLARGDTENIARGFEGTNKNPGTWTTAFFAALWSYSGWNCINMMSGEIKDAGKNVPRALVLSQVLLISVYLLANLAYCSILSLDELYHEDAIALYVGRKMLGEFGETWARAGELFFGISVAVSSFGSLSSSLMGSSRLPFIAAQEGMMPQFLALIQKSTGTPIVSLIFIGGTAFLCVWSSTISTLISYVGFLSWFWWGLCFLAVPILRLKMPHSHRQFEVFMGFPVLAVLSTIYLVVGPFFVTPIPCLAWIGVTLIGVPVFYGYVDKKNVAGRSMDWVLLKLSKLLRADL